MENFYSPAPAHPQLLFTRTRTRNFYSPAPAHPHPHPQLLFTRTRNFYSTAPAHSHPHPHSPAPAPALTPAHEKLLFTRNFYSTAPAHPHPINMYLEQSMHMLSEHNHHYMWSIICIHSPVESHSICSVVQS